MMRTMALRVNNLDYRICFFLVGDMKGKAPIKGSAGVTAKFADLHCGGVCDELYDRLLARGPDSELRIGTYEEYQAGLSSQGQSTCDVFMFTYQLRMKLYSDGVRYLQSEAFSTDLDKHLKACNRTEKQIAAHMKRTEEEKAQYMTQKADKFRDKKRLEFAQAHGHAQVDSPLVSFCDDDTQDALHCKVRVCAIIPYIINDIYNLVCPNLLIRVLECIYSVF
jgi:hypothetical protein